MVATATDRLIWVKGCLGKCLQIVDQRLKTNRKAPANLADGQRWQSRSGFGGFADDWRGTDRRSARVPAGQLFAAERDMDESAQGTARASLCGYVIITD